MAERRMFAKSVVQSGRFIRLPGKVQALYFQLGMFADDDGFVSAPDFAIQASGTTRRDLSRLEEEGLLYRFEGNLLLIRHWFTHNTIQKDRFRPTMYQEELSRVTLENRVYEMDPDWIQNGNILDPQIKQNKRKQNERKLTESKPNEISPVPSAAGDRRPTLLDAMKYAAENGFVISPADFFFYYDGNGWMEEGEPVRDWQALMTGWDRRARHAGTP